MTCDHNPFEEEAFDRLVRQALLTDISEQREPERNTGAWQAVVSRIQLQGGPLGTDLPSNATSRQREGHGK
jgi:hypothetical protein